MVVPVVGAALGAFNGFILAELPAERAHRLRAVVYAFFAVLSDVNALTAFIARANVDVHAVTSYTHNSP